MCIPTNSVTYSPYLSSTLSIECYCPQLNHLLSGRLHVSVYTVMEDEGVTSYQLDSSPLVYNNECVLYVICIVCVCCVWNVYTLIRCGVHISCLYLPLKWVSHCPNTLLWSAYTPLELTNITWYLGSDGVKIGVPGLQRVNGQMFIMRSLI